MDDSIMFFHNGPFVILKAGELVKTTARMEEGWIEACFQVARKRYTDRKLLFDKCQRYMNEDERWEQEKAEYERKSNEEFWRRVKDDMVNSFLNDTMRKADLELLGLSGTPDGMAIKAAYRKMSMIHHPDKGGDQEKFVRVKEAYERLLKIALATGSG